jgi:predicted phosphoadenosine phosphosulfate sulfurtransferase
MKILIHKTSSTLVNLLNKYKDSINISKVFIIQIEWAIRHKAQKKYISTILKEVQPLPFKAEFHYIRKINLLHLLLIKV